LKRAISIIGSRRSGKTYMMFLLIRRLIRRGVDSNRILYFNFESYDLIGAKINDAKRLVDIYFEIYPENRARQLIQVCYEIEDFKVREREIKSILKASRDLACKNLLIITFDYEDVEKIGGRKIVFKPLWKWLLEISR